MDMGMVTLVVKGRVPPQMVHRNLEILGKGLCLSPQKISPAAAVVEPQPGRILPFQGENCRVHIAFVIVHLL